MTVEPHDGIQNKPPNLLIRKRGKQTRLGIPNHRAQSLIPHLRGRIAIGTDRSGLCCFKIQYIHAHATLKNPAFRVSHSSNPTSAREQPKLYPHLGGNFRNREIVALHGQTFFLDPECRPTTPSFRACALRVQACFVLPSDIPANP